MHDVCTFLYIFTWEHQPGVLIIIILYNYFILHVSVSTRQTYLYMKPFCLVLFQLIVMASFNIIIYMFCLRERKEDRDRHKGKTEVHVSVLGRLKKN